MAAKKSQVSGEEAVQLEAAVLDIDYINLGDNSTIRMTVKAADGSVHELLDTDYKPYFYFVPTGKNDLSGVFFQDGERVVKPVSIEKAPRTLLGRPVESVKVTVNNASHVPKLSDAMAHLGDAYENDIPFAKRYSIDKSITPLTMNRITARRNAEGRLLLESMEPTGSKEPVRSASCAST